MIRKTPRLRVGSWFGRRFQVFTQVLIIVLGRFWKLFRVKVNLDDSFTFLSSFVAGSMLCKQLGNVLDAINSWKLIWTTVARFLAVLWKSWIWETEGMLEPSRPFWTSSWPPKMGPKFVEHGIEMGVISGSFCFDLFILGAIWGQTGPRSANMHPRRASRASKYRKTTFTKSVISLAETILFESLPKRSYKA